jgi:hypothetical protein
MEDDREVLVWHAYEHEHIEREADWYWAIGIVAFSAALTSVIFGNYLFAFIIVIALGLLAALARHKPELTRFELSKKGVRTGEHMHAYNEIIAFHMIDETEGEPRLLVATKKFSTPILTTPISHFEPEEIRAFLKRHAVEKPLREPIGHRVLEFFGM